MKFEYGTSEYKEWMARADEAKEKCTQEAFDALPNLYRILNNKVGINLTYDASMKEDAYGKEYINIRSSDLPLDGWTKFLFRSVVIGTFNSSVGVSKIDGEYDMSQEPEAYYWMTVTFSYNHTGGGRNGHDFATCWFEDGQWKVEFVDEDELVTSSRKEIKSSLKEELEKQMKERHLKLNPDGDTPDLSAAVEYIEQNDDWYIGTDEQKARKWIRDTLENSDDLITSSITKGKIQSSAIGEKLRKADKFSGGREVDRAFNSDSFADFKRHLAKAVDKANQNGSRMFRDKWEDVEFTESEMKYLFNGPDGYNLPTSTERTLSPEEKKQRKQWQDDFTYGESVHSIGYDED